MRLFVIALHVLACCRFTQALDTGTPVCSRSSADVTKLTGIRETTDPFFEYQICKRGNDSCIALRSEICSGDVICEHPTTCDLRCKRLEKVPSVFTCKDNRSLEYAQLCDGLADCVDGEDELKSPDDRFDPFDEFQRCNNPKNDFNDSCLVSRDQICAREITCSNLTPCDLKCNNHYVCQNSNACLPRATVCDSDACDGCPEDHEWRAGHGFKCRRNGRECILPQQLLHDDVPDCDGGTDICFGAITVLDPYSRNQRQSPDNLDRKKCFLCLNETMIIPASRVCDGIIDCADMSDECLCEDGAPEICGQVLTDKIEAKDSLVDASAVCEVGHVMCKSGKCIPRDAVCDGIKDCEEDESYESCGGTMRCKDATGYEKSCRCDRGSSSSSYEGTACDGVPDCPVPLVDGYEMGTNNTFPKDECEASCPVKAFKCEKYVPREIKTWNHGAWCYIPDDIELPEHFTFSVEKEEYCDGIVDCELSGSDEEESDDCSRFTCDAIRPSFVSITKEQVCDGVIDCKDGSDESFDMCGGKFSCPMLGGTKISLNKEYVCDYTINCDDASDEEECKDDRFYCESGSPMFVRRHQVKDHRGDCDDWSDECPTINGSTQVNAFSSRYELISNFALRVIVWVMAAFAILGNVGVIWREFTKLREKDKLTSAIRANRLLILNLALADLLMGAYLLTLCVQMLRMSGVYCSKDLEWRSSDTCIVMGILNVVSSETSVITMVMLTACRVYAVMRPFKSKSLPRKRHVCLMMCLAWAMALVLAFLPLTPSLAHVFVGEVSFSYNPFSRNATTKLVGARDIFNDLLTFDLKDNVTTGDMNLDVTGATWTDLSSASAEYFSRDYFMKTNSWGYYSTASVCIPKFFVSRSDPAWLFSFIVNFFNFASFVFVATAYVIIYVKTRREQANVVGESRGEDRSLKSMQRKILRLIITDFCCWVPVSIMAFCKLGGVEIGDTAYAVAAVVLLPVNSAVNPLLYSDFFDNIFKKGFWMKIRHPSSSSQSCSSRSTHTSRFATTIVRGRESPIIEHKPTDTKV